ncbi:MAG: hypothetical protein U5L08_06495 [Xanthomonadales bacterium]|nr:hypothetical protein [Xanthomonadales bacterium]
MRTWCSRSAGRSWKTKPAARRAGADREGALLIGNLDPAGAPQSAKAYADAGIDAFASGIHAADLARAGHGHAVQPGEPGGLPRGDRRVYEFKRGFPMMMTAAGTVPPAKTLVMGAGVAGLQAIATARRLGSVVSATDVRPAAKEQVEEPGRVLRRRRGRGVQGSQDPPAATPRR